MNKAAREGNLVELIRLHLNGERCTKYAMNRAARNGHLDVVKFLHENGYTGKSDEDVVNKWFNDVCRTVLVQEIADQDYGLQEETERTDVIKREPGQTGEDETSDPS